MSLLQPRTEARSSSSDAMGKSNLERIKARLPRSIRSLVETSRMNHGTLQHQRILGPDCSKSFFKPIVWFSISFLDYYLNITYHGRRKKRPEMSAAAKIFAYWAHYGCWTSQIWASLSLVIRRLRRSALDMSTKSSAGRPRTSFRIALLVTLRSLAGASYLDLSWPYGIFFSTVHKLFYSTLLPIDNSLDNIRFPTSEDNCRNSATKFQVMRRSAIWGIIAALVEWLLQ